MEDLPEEYDNCKRYAEVCLYTSPIELCSGSSNSNPLGGTYLPKQLLHWALVFEFENGDYRCIEALNKDNKLMPFFSKERPSYETDPSKIGKTFISPLQVRELARKNPYSYKDYSFGRGITCQQWVVKCLEQLSFKSPYFSTGTFGTWMVLGIISFAATLLLRR